jgi:hypothetical protein
MPNIGEKCFKNLINLWSKSSNWAFPRFCFLLLMRWAVLGILRFSRPFLRLSSLINFLSSPVTPYFSSSYLVPPYFYLVVLPRLRHTSFSRGTGTKTWTSSQHCWCDESPVSKKNHQQLYLINKCIFSLQTWAELPCQLPWANCFRLHVHNQFARFLHFPIVKHFIPTPKETVNFIRLKSIMEKQTHFCGIC